jgi:hypothetical protein
MRILLAVLCVLSLATAAYAVPTCVPGTMADYLALTEGCRSGGVTVSDFSFSAPSGSAMDLLVTPAPGPTRGALRLILTIGEPFSSLGVTFTANADPLIHQLGIAFSPFPPSFGDFSVASLNGVTVVNFVPSSGHIDVFSGLTAGFPPVAVKDFDFSFFSDETRSHVITLDVYTPEPATLLLWGAGAMGLGLARWRKRRAR